MSHLLDGFLGVLTRQTYRIEVRIGTAPKSKRAAIPEGAYLYVTKMYFDGAEIGNRSIGMPAADVPELLAILGKVAPE